MGALVSFPPGTTNPPATGTLTVDQSPSGTSDTDTGRVLSATQTFLSSFVPVQQQGQPALDPSDLAPDEVALNPGIVGLVRWK